MGRGSFLLLCFDLCGIDEGVGLLACWLIGQFWIISLHFLHALDSFLIQTLTFESSLPDSRFLVTSLQYIRSHYIL